jgi:hypothetical protein
MDEQPLEEEMELAEASQTPSIEDIVTALQREFDDAEDFYTAEIQPEEEVANMYYEAKPFGDEVEGRSQIVLPDVAEAIDYMSISVLRTFLSGDRVIEIEATDADDEEAADEATAALHYNFMREQDGSRILGDWLQSGLLERIGVAKTVCYTEEKISREQFIVDAEQIQALDAGMLPMPEGAELEDIADNGDGTFTAKLKVSQVVKRYRDVAIPLKEFRFARNARHEDDADYVAHVCLKTRSELVEMGFDRDQVDDLPTADGLSTMADRYDEEMWRDSNDLPNELQTVLLCEEYAKMDVDGDGIAERVKIFRVENEILKDAETGEPSIETVTENPFSVFCPFPRAHRMVGNSLADKSMDIMRIRSVVARQMQDGMYLANMPRPMVDMAGEHASVTIEDLLRPIPGSPIRYRGQAPMPYQAGLDVGKSLSVLEYWNGERETRTGITRLNQGLDADTLNKTATGASLMAAQGQQMEEAIARQFGEAFGRLMAKKMRLMKAEGAEFPVKVDGQYTMANASQWPDEFRLIVRVGLGTGRKEQRLQYLFALGQLMERGYPIGAVDSTGLFRLGSEIVSAMQLGQGDDYFVNPEEQQGEEGPSDEDKAMQADQMKEQMKAQSEQMKAQAKAQGEQMKVQAKLQGDQMKAEASVMTARERMQHEAELRREEMDLEAQLAIIKMELTGEGSTSINDTSPGGNLAR